MKPTPEALSPFQAHVAEGLSAIGMTGRGPLAEGLAVFAAMVRRSSRAAGLTAEKDDRELVLRMAVEPLIALALLPPERPLPLLDVGAGAGSPGIPLALADDGLEVLMLEPDRRKSVFIGEAIRALRLRRVRVSRDRIEETLAGGIGDAYRVLVSRAAMKPGRLAALVGERMPRLQRMVLFLGEWGPREVEQSGHFRLLERRPVPWKRSSHVALFERR